MPLDQPRTVDELLNFRIARLLASSGALVIRLCEGRYGITRREWRMIAILAAHGPMSPSDLAAHAYVDRARASRVVTELVSKGLLDRHTLPGDKRRAIISLSGRGRALHDELFPLSADINSLIMKSLTAEQLAVFDQALDLLTAAAEGVTQNYPLNLKADRRHGGSRRISQAR
jgi:DNA-binding MarR family transcriptional regulator